VRFAASSPPHTGANEGYFFALDALLALLWKITIGG
jgi:hypothetical protein